MFEPTGYYVLVKPKDVETKTAGGIVLVDDTVESDKVHTVEGTLVAVGPTAWKGFDNGEAWAKVGDKVVYAKFAGKRLYDHHTDQTFILMNDNDIIARVVSE